MRTAKFSSAIVSVVAFALVTVAHAETMVASSRILVAQSGGTDKPVGQDAGAGEFGAKTQPRSSPGFTPDTRTTAPGATQGYSSEEGAGSDVGGESPRRAGAEDERGAVEAFFEDSAITSQVKFALLEHDRLSGFAINASTERGVVTLTGEVGSEAERRLAAEVARGIEGVRRVDVDQLVIE